MRYYWYIIFLIFGLCGCGVKNIDKPPPPWWKDFSKGNMSEYDIRKALLECGSNYPGDINEFHNLPRNDMNKLILTEKCMQESGFLNKDLGVCVRLKSQNYSACNSNVEILKRSVETRLNSPYCKTYPESNYCAP